MALDLTEWALPETVAYWPPLGADGTGEQGYGEVVALPARWQDRVQQVIDINGEIQQAVSEVLLATEVLPNGVLWLSPTNGTIGGLTDEVNPFNNSGALRILTSNSDPTLDDDDVLYTAFLAKVTSQSS